LAIHIFTPYLYPIFKIQITNVPQVPTCPGLPYSNKWRLYDFQVANESIGRYGNNTILQAAVMKCYELLDKDKGNYEERKEKRDSWFQIIELLMQHKRQCNIIEMDQTALWMALEDRETFVYLLRAFVNRRFI